MSSNPFQRDFEEQSLQTLYRKMKKTAKARFNASKRLQRHQQYSLWSLSFFSAGMIVLPLLPVFQISLNTSESTNTLIGVILALFVLVLSLLLSSNNYSDKAEKMHRCALELNALCYEILPACRENTDTALYNSVLIKYNNILNSYENHADIDFELVRTDLREEYPLKPWQRGWIYLCYWLHFWIYGLLLLILLGTFAYVLR